MPALTALRPGVWLRMPAAVSDSPLRRWRQLAEVRGGQRMVFVFADGTEAPFHADNLHLLETADTNPEETK